MRSQPFSCKSGLNKKRTNCAMKNCLYIIIFSITLLCLSCTNGDDPNAKDGICGSGKIEKSVTNTEGIIYYNTQEKAFNIVVTIPNTYDSQDIGFVCELPENLKQDGAKVIISGDYRGYGKQAAIGGQKYYYLSLSKIEKK